MVLPSLDTSIAVSPACEHHRGVGGGQQFGGPCDRTLLLVESHGKATQTAGGR